MLTSLEKIQFIPSSAELFEFPHTQSSAIHVFARKTSNLFNLLEIKYDTLYFEHLSRLTSCHRLTQFAKHHCIYTSKRSKKRLGEWKNIRVKICLLFVWLSLVYAMLYITCASIVSHIRYGAGRTLILD